ncbi:hypothetical protein B0T11DRAFT_145061 [Plectosphaerella cucumerina]|uniref:Uncharacterized protein n=1 Tax=Plectosphaerella cucumerina TaxID=40658 RepID=A0A8K0T514_9PEZI|nr:hypothetical protein B0T11DRAFT_145061 [Plectosphaerella cucumerina]
MPRWEKGGEAGPPSLGGTHARSNTVREENAKRSRETRFLACWQSGAGAVEEASTRRPRIAQEAQEQKVGRPSPSGDKGHRRANRRLRARGGGSLATDAKRRCSSYGLGGIFGIRSPAWGELIIRLEEIRTKLQGACTGVRPETPPWPCEELPKRRTLPRCRRGVFASVRWWCMAENGGRDCPVQACPCGGRYRGARRNIRY